MAEKAKEQWYTSARTLLFSSDGIVTKNTYSALPNCKNVPVPAIISPFE